MGPSAAYTTDKGDAMKVKTEESTYEKELNEVAEALGLRLETILGSAEDNFKALKAATYFVTSDGFIKIRIPKKYNYLNKTSLYNAAKSLLDIALTEVEEDYGKFGLVLEIQ